MRISASVQLPYLFPLTSCRLPLQDLVISISATYQIEKQLDIIFLHSPLPFYKSIQFTCHDQPVIKCCSRNIFSRIWQFSSEHKRPLGRVLGEYFSAASGTSEIRISVCIIVITPGHQICLGNRSVVNQSSFRFFKICHKRF